MGVMHVLNCFYIMRGATLISVHLQVVLLPCSRSHYVVVYNVQCPVKKLEFSYIFFYMNPSPDKTKQRNKTAKYFSDCLFIVDIAHLGYNL
jgi:hypothetical protein